MGTITNHNKKVEYDSIKEQEQTLSRLITLESKTPLSERFFFSHSDKLASFVLLGTGVVYWRAGFRGFNLYKYDKSRMPSLLMTTVTSVNGCLLNQIGAKNKLIDYFRNENMWIHGLRSLIYYNLALGITIPTALFFTFAHAQRYGLVIVPDKFTAKENRPIFIREVTARLRPRTRSLLIAYVASSLFMFYAGCKSYSESISLLHKIGRKTIALKES